MSLPVEVALEAVVEYHSDRRLHRILHWALGPLHLLALRSSEHLLPDLPQTAAAAVAAVFVQVRSPTQFSTKIAFYKGSWLCQIQDTAFSDGFL